MAIYRYANVYIYIYLDIYVYICITWCPCLWGAMLLPLGLYPLVFGAAFKEPLAGYGATGLHIAYVALYSGTLPEVRPVRQTDTILIWAP